VPVIRRSHGQRLYRDIRQVTEGISASRAFYGQMKPSERIGEPDILQNSQLRMGVVSLNAYRLNQKVVSRSNSGDGLMHCFASLDLVQRAGA